MNASLVSRFAMFLLLIAGLGGSVGCTAFMEPREPYPATPPEPPITSSVPRELEKVTLPRYVIEPPDVLLIEGVRLVPKSPHTLEFFDVVLIRVIGALPDQPVDNTYIVESDGTVNLGPAYGRIKIAGETVEEAEVKIRDELKKVLQEAEVSVSLIQTAGAQQITGQHLVGPDGRVNMGTYGAVYVAGATVEQARRAIEELLAEQLEDPEVFVDVLAYNSKVYYVITDGAGQGDSVVKLPITGNETVLDAVANIGGISQFSSSRMWIARPAPNGVGCEQILPVSWEDISAGAATATNYQLMPGDRLFIDGDPVFAFGATVQKVLRPFEQIFAFVSLSTSTANRIVRFGLGNTF